MTDLPAVPLLERVRLKIRLKHYSIRTEQAYTDWIKRFILFHGKRHPATLGAGDVEAFLTHLAAVRNVAANTQNQAKSALLFLYREVLAIELPWLDHVERAKTPMRLPVVLTVAEVVRVLDRLDSQCLYRRLQTRPLLAAEIAAWEQRRNAERRSIAWTFTRQDADRKMGQHYVS